MLSSEPRERIDLGVLSVPHWRYWLTGWQRLGIVISVVWIIGSGVWLRVVYNNQAEKDVEHSYKSCNDLNEAAFQQCTIALKADDYQNFGKCSEAHNVASLKCNSDMEKNIVIYQNDAAKEAWKDLYSLSKLVLVLLWTIGSFSIYAVYWIIDGFKHRKC